MFGRPGVDATNLGGLVSSCCRALPSLAAWPSANTTLGACPAKAATGLPSHQLPRHQGVDAVRAGMAGHGTQGQRRGVEPTGFLAAQGVRAHGPVPHAGIAEVLGASDVLVVPSIWPETAGLVIR